MQGIKAPPLLPMKTAFFRQTHLTFDSVIAGFRAFLENSKQNHLADTKVLNVSQVSNIWSNTHNKRKSSKISQDADGYNPGQSYDQFKMEQRYYATKEWNALQPGQRNYLCSASAVKRLQKASTGSDTKRQLNKLRTQVAALTARHADDPASDASDEENVAPTKGTKRSVRLKSLKC